MFHSISSPLSEQFPSPFFLRARGAVPKFPHTWVPLGSGLSEEQCSITECHTGCRGCSNDASYTQSSGRRPGTLLSGDSPSSMSLERGWWGVVELRQRGSRACHNLSVLCSCRAYLRSLKAAPLHDLCPSGKCHELLFTAYWGVVAGRLSQVRRVRHGAPCGRIILCVLTTISYHQIYLNYSRINRDQTSRSVVWITRTRAL